MLLDKVDILLIIEKIVNPLKLFIWYMKKKFGKECCRIILLQVIYNRYCEFDMRRKMRKIEVNYER